ncbi:MAG: hypothetical protein LKE50_02960 [Atopobiaceae bacterium]|nr:hypothetical protein [Atopobiaceae bacterium]
MPAAPSKHHFDDELIGGDDKKQSKDTQVINEDIDSLDDLLTEVVRHEDALGSADDDEA